MKPLRVLSIAGCGYVGTICLAAFLWIVWPPLVLAGAGLALIGGAFLLSQTRDGEVE